MDIFLNQLKVVQFKVKVGGIYGIVIWIKDL